MVKRAIEMEGTATGEHGVGMVKRDYLEHEVGRTTIDMMRKVSCVRVWEVFGEANHTGQDVRF
jgi:hypothetical protein